MRFFKKVQPIFFFMLVAGFPGWSTDCDPTVEGEYVVAARVEITDRLINRFLDEQYQRAGFPRNLSGTIQGIDYNINLYLPTITLTQYAMYLHMGFDASASVAGAIIGQYSFEVTPAIDINTCGITTSMVTAYLQNLAYKIQILNLPDWLETVVIAAYDSLELELYPAQLLEAAQPDWFRQRALELSDLGISWRFWNGTLQLSLLVGLDGEPQNFRMFPYGNATLIDANLEARLTNLDIYNFSGTLVLHLSPNLTTVKKGTAVLDLGWGLGFFTVIAEFETDDTVFVRTWLSIEPGHEASLQGGFN